MPELFGKQFSAVELRRLIGANSQVAGIRTSDLSDGKARGIRVADIHTGSGFHFTVLIDRGMDIGAAGKNGKSLAWIFPSLGGPELYEPDRYGWGRTWGGGLMTTAGLTFFGQPETDEGEVLGLHGRISHLPAANLKITQEWRGDDYAMEIAGETRQVVLGGENLVLARKISTKLGASSFTLEDTVRNEGFRATPHMILYHCNFGFPVVSPQSELLVNDESVRPRDERAKKGFDTYTRFLEPQDEYPEQVFFHKPRVDAEGYSQGAIVNRSLNFGGYVRFRAAELPFFAHWKQLTKGEYVCALEPANQWETPRQKLREEGRLRLLEPGEEVHYRLEFGALDGPDEIRAFEQHLKQSTGGEALAGDKA